MSKTNIKTFYNINNDDNNNADESNDTNHYSRYFEV